jgi:hypothetical protein
MVEMDGPWKWKSGESIRGSWVRGSHGIQWDAHITELRAQSSELRSQVIADNCAQSPKSLL